MSVRIRGLKGGKCVDAGPPLTWDGVNAAAVLRLLDLEPPHRSGDVPIWRARRAIMWARGTFGAARCACAVARAHQLAGTMAAELEAPAGPSTAYLAEQIERFADKVEHLAAAGCSYLLWSRRRIGRRARPGRGPGSPTGQGGDT